MCGGGGEAEVIFELWHQNRSKIYHTHKKLTIKQRNKDCIIRLFCTLDPCQICLHLLTFTDAVHTNAGKLLLRLYCRHSQLFEQCVIHHCDYLFKTSDIYIIIGRVWGGFCCCF